MIALLTEIRDCLTSSRVDQRTSAIQMIQAMEALERAYPRAPTPRPPFNHSPDRHLLPEEHVERSRGRYPAFPLRPQKSGPSLSRSPTYK